MPVATRNVQTPEAGPRRGRLVPTGNYSAILSMALMSSARTTHNTRSTGSSHKGRVLVCLVLVCFCRPRPSARLHVKFSSKDAGSDQALLGRLEASVRLEMASVPL